MARLAQPDRLPVDRRDPGERNEMVPTTRPGFRGELDPRGSVHLFDRTKLLPVGTKDLHLIPDLRSLYHPPPSYTKTNERLEPSGTYPEIFPHPPIVAAPMECL